MANLTETSSSSLVKISGEPLVQSNGSSITRSVTYPTLMFEGMTDSEVTMTITWNTDGSTEVQDSRGYRYLLSIPSSEGAFSLWQNSSVVDQRVIGAEKQYDIFWRPAQNSRGYEDRYEFFIAGTSANATSIKLAIDDGDNNSIVQDDKLRVIHSSPTTDSKIDFDVQGVEGIVSGNNEYEPEGLELDWSDAIDSGYQVDFDVETSLLTIPVGAGGGKPFLIDPYVVGGTNTFISPEIGNYFEGQTRIVTTNNTRLNAFYYDSSNIVYRTSDDRGHTWSSAFSLGTGTVASDKHRWTVVHHIQSGGERINVIYWHVVGNNTNFYSIRGNVTWPSASISWGSPVQIGSTTVNSGCISASGSCVGVATAVDGNGTIYAAFKWVASGATYFSYGIKKSTNGGATWSDSLAEVTGVSIYRPALTLTPLDSTKMLFAYLKYDSADLYYRIFNGTSWGTVQTVTGTGMASNTYKQISSTVDATGQGVVTYTNVTASAGGIVKIARIFANGTFSTIETVDSTLRHNLPSIFSYPNGDLNILSISNGKVYVTRKIAGVWEAPFNPFGTTFTSLDQLSGAIVLDGALAGMWRESTGSPYNVVFGLLEPGTVMQDSLIFNSPLSSESFAGERRLVESSNHTQFAFYDGGFNIVYKTSKDLGRTWSASATSTGTGILGSDSRKWTIAYTHYNSTERITLVYVQEDHSDNTLYAKTFVIHDKSLSLFSTRALRTETTDNSCLPGGICATTAAASSTNGTIFVTYTFKTGGNWYMQDYWSKDGGWSWIPSPSPTQFTGMTGANEIPVTLTRLDSGKMLKVYTAYGWDHLGWQVYNGTGTNPWGDFWSGCFTCLSSNTTKQIASDTMDGFSSNSSRMAFVAYLTSGNHGTLKVAKFYGNGTFAGVETADSTLDHSIPAISITPDDNVHIFTLSGGNLYETLRNATTGWQTPNTTYGTIFQSPDQLTAKIATTMSTGILLREGNSSPYTLRSDGQFSLSNPMTCNFHVSKDFHCDRHINPKPLEGYTFFLETPDPVNNNTKGRWDLHGCMASRLIPIKCVDTSIFTRYPETVLYLGQTHYFLGGTISIYGVGVPYFEEFQWTGGDATSGGNLDKIFTFNNVPAENLFGLTDEPIQFVVTYSYCTNVSAPCSVEASTVVTTVNLVLTVGYDKNVR